MLSVTHRLLQSRYCFINNRLSFYNPNRCRTSGLSFPVEKVSKINNYKKNKTDRPSSYPIQSAIIMLHR